MTCIVGSVLLASRVQPPRGTAPRTLAVGVALGMAVGLALGVAVVAALGTGNARAMAAGISRATIPTMAGLLVALPGLYFSLQLEQLTGRKAQELGDRLRMAREARI